MKQGLQVLGINYRDQKEMKYYKCYWPVCETEFYHWVRKFDGQDPKGTHNAVSTQVKCPECGNGLKTWKEYE